jgi:hypothetical protein
MSSTTRAGNAGEDVPASSVTAPASTTMLENNFLNVFLTLYPPFLFKMGIGQRFIVCEIQALE